MSKNYQNDDEKDTAGMRVGAAEVTIALAELTGQVPEGAAVVGGRDRAGGEGQLMEADVTELAGPKGRHEAGRAAVRPGVVDVGPPAVAGEPAAGTGH